MKHRIRAAAAADFSTEGLLESLLDVLGNTNTIISNIDEIEIGIHDAKASGDPVSTGANAVIGLLDSVRGHYEEAREILLTRLDVLVGKATKQIEQEEEPEEEKPEPKPPAE